MAAENSILPFLKYSINIKQFFLIVIFHSVTGFTDF